MFGGLGLAALKWSALSGLGKVALVGGVIAAVPLSTMQLGAVSALVVANQPTSVSATVARVVDGDTIHVTVGGANRTVRLLNIDSPETVDPNRPVGCLGPEASAKLAELLPVGSAVTLEYDVRRTDKYGRDLAGVTRPGQEMANVAMVRSGLAVPYDDTSNKKFYPPVLAAAKSAQASAVGLFASDQECTLAHEIAQLEKQQAELTALPAAVVETDIDAIDAKAVAVGVTAAALLERITKKATFEVSGLPTSTLTSYRGSIETIATSATSLRSSLASKRAALKAEAEAARVAAEAAAKAQAEAAAKAQAEAAAAAAAAAAEEQRRADEAAAADAARKAAAKPQPFVGGGATNPEPAPEAPSGGSVYYKNCAAARAAGAAPVRVGQPGYGSHLDRDGDGIGCER